MNREPQTFDNIELLVSSFSLKVQLEIFFFSIIGFCKIVTVQNHQFYIIVVKLLPIVSILLKSKMLRNSYLKD